MSYQPVIPFGGYAGWVVLQRTKENQQEVFNQSTEMKRETDYFRENIGNIKTAEDLVSDYRMLKVALGAFGLDEDINSKYFIQKVLDEGTLDGDALANKLSDKRYYEFSKSFGFGNFEGGNTSLSYFADDIVSAYQEKQFQVAVGEQNEDMRLALNLDQELSKVVDKSTTDDGRWYAVMGNPALRSVFQTALGLPTSIGTIDLDQQLRSFRDKAESYLGDSEISQFSDPEKTDELVKLFLIRSELNSGYQASYSAASNALTLLSGSF